MSTLLKHERLTQRLSTPQPVSGWKKPEVGQTVYFRDLHGNVVSGELWSRAVPRHGHGSSDPWFVWVSQDDVRLVEKLTPRSPDRVEVRS